MKLLILDYIAECKGFILEAKNHNGHPVESPRQLQPGLCALAVLGSGAADPWTRCGPVLTWVGGVASCCPTVPAPPSLSGIKAVKAERVAS